MVSLTDAQELWIESVIAGIPFLSFKRATGVFEVSEAISDPSWEQARMVLEAVRRLNLRPSPQPPLHTIRVDQFTMGYFDRCLECYCYERLNLGKAHQETFWARFASRIFCLGRIDPRAEFDDRAKERFLENVGRERRDNVAAMSAYRAYRKNPAVRQALTRDAEGWLMFYFGDIPLAPLGRARRLGASVKRVIKRTLRYQPDDRVLSVVRSIESRGWVQELAREGGVLGYSRETGRYFAITGKHRIAALKYLHSQGKIDGATPVHYPVVTYPWGPWLRGRPHPDIPLCERCEWA